MANIWDQFVTGLGQQNAPFGFAPPQNGIVQGNPAYGNGMQFIGDMGAGMLANSGRNPMEAFGQAYGQAQEKSRDRSKDAMVMQQMMQQAEQERQKREEERQRKAQLEQYISTLPPEQQALARMFPEKVAGAQIDQQFAPPGSNTPEYGLNPIWTNGPEGYGLYQPSKDGSPPRRMEFPDGVQPQPPVTFQDLGTGVQPFSTRGGNATGGVIPKDLSGAESQKAQGKIQGETTAGAPGDIAAADLALKKIDELRNDPNRAIGTGKSAIFNNIPASPGYDFQTKVDEVTSGAFLTAIQQMRGLGQLSNAEGQTAKAAVTRMNTATSEEEFLDALNDYEEIVMQGRQRAAQRLNGGQAPAESTGNTRYKFNPETGELE